MSSKKQFTDSRWTDHPTLNQLKNNLSSIEKQKISKSEEKKRKKFLDSLYKWANNKN